MNYTIGNLTLHEPTKEMKIWGERRGIWGERRGINEINNDYDSEDTEYGYDPNDAWLFTGPLGIENHSVTPYVVKKTAVKTVHAAMSLGCKAILVGGLSDVTFYQTIEAHRLGLTVYVANTERTRDENERFVFNFIGLREIEVE